MSNFDRLAQAGLLNPQGSFSADDHNMINSLSDSEVDSLISAKQKVGPLLDKHHGEEAVSAASQGKAAVGIVF